MTKKEVKARLVRKASRAVVGGFRPPADPFTSWFGSVRIALPDETWPTWDGKPMMPLCQFNLTQLPFRPDALADIALITVFIKQGETPPLKTANGDEWLLRAYPSLEGLAAIQEPADRGYIKPFPIRWEVINEDYPTWDDASSMELPAKINIIITTSSRRRRGQRSAGGPAPSKARYTGRPLTDIPRILSMCSRLPAEKKRAGLGATVASVTLGAAQAMRAISGQ